MPNPPVDPALEERVARALYLEGASFGGITCGFNEGQAVAKIALAALTTDDLIQLLQGRSDEEVVSLTRDEASALAERADYYDIAGGLRWKDPFMRILDSARSKLSTALEGE